MQAINTIATAPAAATSALPPKTKAEEEKSQFLKLFVAQLKGQNPLDPKDGTEFVSQLAQFSSLEELINIRTTLESFKTTVETNSDTTATNPFQEATSANTHERTKE